MGAAPSLTGVLEAALYADDLEAAAGFYGGVLGLPQIMRQEGRHVFFRCGSTIVLVFRAEATRQPAAFGALAVPSHGSVGAGHICFVAERDELDLWSTRLKANGIEIEADFEWPDGARSVYVRDPAGNSVEFAEARMWKWE